MPYAYPLFRAYSVADIYRLFFPTMLTGVCLQWCSGQPEKELGDKFAFARSKVGAQNPGFSALVPVVCPERTCIVIGKDSMPLTRLYPTVTDLASLTKNSAASALSFF